MDFPPWCFYCLYNLDARLDNRFPVFAHGQLHQGHNNPLIKGRVPHRSDKYQNQQASLYITYLFLFYEPFFPKQLSNRRHNKQLLDLIM